MRHLLLIVAVWAAVVLTNLGGPRLWDRDEPRNAGCTREMLARGDWVTPVFDGELRTHKPILLYWFMMAAYGCFGENEFAARFWSAVAALGTALVTYDIGRRLVSPAIGLWAAVILLSTLMFNVAARAATPDSLLIFWGTAAIGAVLAGWYPRPTVHAAAAGGGPDERPLPWGWGALAYACMGLAVLAKGPVGVVLPGAVVGLFLLVHRPPAGEASDGGRPDPSWRARFARGCRYLTPRHVLRTLWSLRPLTALAVVLLVALPWYLAVAHRTDGAWVRGFLWDHNIGRAARSLEGHRGPLWYYPVALLVGFFPWSVFAVPVTWEVVVQWRRRSPARTALILGVCWIAVYIGLFSLAQTKLPSYITPCYPAVALLVAVFVHAWCTDTTAVPSAWRIAALVCLAAVSVVMLVALPLLLSRHLPGSVGLTGIAAIGLVTAAVGLWCLQRRAPRPAAVAFVVGACALCGSLFAVGAACVARYQTFDTFVTYLRDQGAAEVGTLGLSEPSWVFYLGRPLARLSLPASSASAAEATAAGSGGEADPVGCGASGVPLQKPSLDAWRFLREQPQRYAITSRRYLEQVGGPPPGIEVVAHTPYFLHDDTLLLLAARWWAPP